MSSSPHRRDAARNRERLVAVTARAFARGDTGITLDAIAREAGVGIGTLYRHFPRRESLVAEVYRAELAQVCRRAGTLLARNPPDVALRKWFDAYANFVATKRGMAETLQAMLASGAVVPGETRASVTAAVAELLDAGTQAGTLRRDVRAEDVVAALVGAFLAVGRDGAPLDRAQRRQVGRLLDLLVAGLRTR